MRYIYCILSSAITFFCFLVNKIKYCHTWKKSLQPVWMNAIGFFICIWLNMRFRQRLFKVEGKKAWLCRKSTAWLCVAGIWKQNVQQFFLALDCWEVWDWCNELIYSSSCRVISLCLWNYKFVTGNLPIFFLVMQVWGVQPNGISDVLVLRMGIRSWFCWEVLLGHN